MKNSRASERYAKSLLQLSIEKDLGNGRTRRYTGVGIHVTQWFTLFKREKDNLQPTFLSIGLRNSK